VWNHQELTTMSITIYRPGTAGEPSLAERMGYKKSDKLLMIHADDIGMCHSVNVATIEAMEKGVVTSASIMVPCPWFPEIAEYCRKNPDADYGLHLTLTSEWRSYRWRPLQSRQQAPGLYDKEGFIHRSVEDTVKYASADEVEREMRLQVARALEFGIKPSHIDSHMGTLFMGKFYPRYVKVGKDTGIMPMLLSPTPERMKEGKEVFGLDFQTAYNLTKKQNFVHLDILKEDAYGDTLATRRAHYYDAFRKLQPGVVTEFICHLSMDDQEIRNVTGNWLARYNEYLIMTDPKTRDLIDSLGIKLFGYRDLQKLAFKPG
jgi:predicted glycoside hydrolase/deacetylase ChbG (UPF0249 family)